MEQKHLEVYSETSNYGVVRMPGRAFPGSVIQGDSLSILCDLARSMQRRAVQIGDSELVDESAELLQVLEDRLHHYEQVLSEHGIRLPYTQRIV
jgi:hypothetical protein